MSGHPDLERLLTPDLPGGEERTALLQHLRGCATCRAALAERDPARLFALLALDPVPAEALARLSAGVAREIERLDPLPVAGRRWVWASLAASLLLAVTLGVYVLQRPDATPAPEVAALSPAFAGPAVPTAGIELLSAPESAEVVAFSIGDTQVMMIFDEDLDL